MASLPYITGRPTAYDPSFCEAAINFLAQGYSLSALAGELSVTRQTVWNWTQAHPEFFDAVKIGEAKGALWWEKRNRSLAETGEGNATACIFGLKNRAANDWRDMRSHDITGTLQVSQEQRIDPLLLEPDERDLLRTLLQAMKDRQAGALIEHQGSDDGE